MNRSHSESTIKLSSLCSLWRPTSLRPVAIARICPVAPSADHPPPAPVWAPADEPSQGFHAAFPVSRSTAVWEARSDKVGVSGEVTAGIARGARTREEARPPGYPFLYLR